MRNRLKILLAILVVPLLLACNLTSLIAAGDGSAPSSARTKTTAIPGANVPLLEGQVRQVVTDFLKSLQTDPNGEAAQAYLAPALVQKVQGGVSVPQMVGSEGKLPNYTLSAITFSPDAAQANVDVSVLYQQPANLRFHLIQTSGSWKIDQITRQENGDSYPSTPEEVVQSFLTSYQENPDKMTRYLSARRLADMPAGGAVGLLNIRGALEGMMVESAAMNPNPPSAVVTVNIRAGGEDDTRLFTLGQENGQWKIDNIENP